MTDLADLDSMSETDLRSAVSGVLEKISRDAKEIALRDARIERLRFEVAGLKHVEYGRLEREILRRAATALERSPRRRPGEP